MILFFATLPSIALPDTMIAYEDEFDTEPDGWTFDDRSTDGGCNWSYDSTFGGFRISPADDTVYDFCESWLELPWIDAHGHEYYDLWIFGEIDKDTEDVLEIWQLINQSEWILLWSVSEGDDLYDYAWTGIYNSWPTKLGFYYKNAVPDVGFWEIDRLEIEAFIGDDSVDDDDTTDDDDESDDDGDGGGGGGGDDDDNGGCCG